MEKFLELFSKFLKDLLLFIIGFGVGLVCGALMQIL